MANKFRLPQQMHEDKDERVPVSTRLKQSTRDFLEKAAEKDQLSLTKLIEGVLEDYADYLRKNGYK